MKHITYTDHFGGTWPSMISIRRGMDFRRILQEATGLERAMGGRVTINITTGGKNEDITEWVHKKALRMR